MEVMMKGPGMRRRAGSRALHWLLALILAGIVLPALGQPAAAQRGAGETLRLFYWQAPTVLNPHLSAGTKDLSASRITYEPLASYDRDGTLVPFLAAEIPSLENGGVAPDARSVTWKLKQGVQWSDGTPFTADDVHFTFEYVTNPDVASTSLANYAMIERVEVVDDYTVTIHFVDVTPAWSLPFVGVQGMIIPRHVFADFAGANAQEAPANLVPVGTGPYRVVEYRTEDVLVIGEDAVSTIKVIYEPNPFYREPDKPFFSRVELQGGGGDALFALQTVMDDQIDFAWNTQADDATLEAFEADGNHKALVSFDAFTERIMINFTDPNAETADGERSSMQSPHPFLTDKRVRQAIALAVDREAIAALYGRGGRATTNILVQPPGYDSPNTQAFGVFDLERAAALLDEAGWVDSDGDGVRDKDGVKMSLVFLTSISATRQGAQEIVKAALESIGVEVQLKSVDSSIFLGPPGESTNTRRQFYADLEEFAFSNKNPDPAAYMQAWTCEESAQMANNWSLSNWSRYCNPAYDELYAQAARELDPELRRQLFIQLNDFLIEDVAVIPLVHLGMISAINADLVGLNTTPWDVEVWNIADWRMA
jgi:peptide/nickel transport system substrate-binding protein